MFPYQPFIFRYSHDYGNPHVSCFLNFPRIFQATVHNISDHLIIWIIIRSCDRLGLVFPDPSWSRCSRSGSPEVPSWVILELAMARNIFFYFLFHPNNHFHRGNIWWWFTGGSNGGSLFSTHFFFIRKRMHKPGPFYSGNYRIIIANK